MKDGEWLENIVPVKDDPLRLLSGSSLEGYEQLPTMFSSRCFQKLLF
jgi:hypothetical protein